MRIELTAELTPQLMAEAGVAYATRDKVYGTKYRRRQLKQGLRAALLLALAAVMFYYFAKTLRTEYMVLGAVGLIIGLGMIYTMLWGDKKRALQKMLAAGGQTRTRRYLITDKKIESSDQEHKTLLRWSDFDRYMETKDSLILLGNKVLVLPKAAMDASQEQLLRAHLVQQLKKV